MKNTYLFLINGIILLFFIVLIACPAQAQVQLFVIKGRVVDKTNLPLPGVSVVGEVNKSHIVTDVNGEYQLKVSLNETVKFSYIGYLNKQVTITNSDLIDVVLEDNVETLGSAVIIGYGKVEKKDLTGAIESLSGKDILKAMTSNVTEALNGRISGVVVTKASNRPGADMKIQIRGQNSFNYSNEPLFVIDGVPSQSGMRHINSDDVESIDVLKDASSAAIYGSRGSNGVVIVTTKGANKKDGFNLEYHGYVGIKTPTRMPDMLGSKGNGLEYVNFRITQWTNKFGASSLSSPSFLTNDERRRVKNGEYYDWLREFAHDGLVSSNSIIASGGNKSTSYTFGLSYTTDEGVAGSESFDRITANLGLEQKFSNNLRSGISTYVSFNNINSGSTDALFNAYLITPIVGRYQIDGSPTFTHRPDGRVNPIIQNENSIHKAEGWSTNASAFIEYKPLEQLALKSQIAAQIDGATVGHWEGSLTQYGKGVKDPIGSRSEGVNTNWVWDNTATYNLKIEESHKINAIGLFSIQKDTHKQSGMTGEGLPYESYWHAIQTADQITNVNSNYWASAMMSFMGRLNYILKSKYMFTLTARYDGTSRLAKENRWGLLPSAAVGWQLKEEQFMSKINFVDNLKLRASWGKTGNNSVGHDVTLTKLDLSSYSLGGSGQKGFGVGGSVGNKDLKWEMTSEYNFGVDFSLFNGRLNGILDAYTRKTTDLIFQRQVATINGYNNVLQNIGTTSNKGFEFSLNSINISKTNFSWRTNLVFSRNKNAIVDLDGSKQDDLANRRFIGQPINVYYDVKSAGIWQEEEKELAKTYNTAPGFIKVVDQDNNGIINENDYKVLGAPYPEFTVGMTNSFTFKNWDFSFYMYMKYGGLYSDPFTYFFTGINNQDWNKLDVPYWTPENRNNTYPGIGLESLYTQVLAQVPGTFLKIQNITLGYTLNDSILKKLKVKQMRLYVSTQNLFTFSSYLGSDPEIIGESLEKQLSLYPMTFNFGLNVKF